MVWVAVAPVVVPLVAEELAETPAQGTDWQTLAVAQQHKFLAASRHLPPEVQVAVDSAAVQGREGPRAPVARQGQG